MTLGPRLAADAAERWGTPLYLTDLDAAAARLALYQAAFPGALIAYAIKANADPQLLRRLVVRRRRLRGGDRRRAGARAPSRMPR